MCDPMTAQLALSAASGMMQASAQNQAAREQNKAYLQNAENARQSMLNDSRALNLRADQEAQAAAQERFQYTIEAAKARATQKVSSGEAGVFAGNNLNYLLNNVEREKLREAQTNKTNLDMTLGQISAEKDSLQYGFMDRVNSVKKGQGVNPLVAGLGIAADAAGTVGSATGYGTTGKYVIGKGIVPK